ncbi:MAG: hypothetical protein IPM54_42635 [Polyangiaceae bacterium]|nr:hypothetical protein [Polyangiaceae bacterium]
MRKLLAGLVAPLLIFVFIACGSREMPPAEDPVDMDTSGRWLTAGECWSCGNTEACFDDHAVNYCLAKCSTVNRYLVVGSAYAVGGWANCNDAATKFCMEQSNGSVEDACWGNVQW